MQLTPTQVPVNIQGKEPLDPIAWVSTEPFISTRGTDKFLRAAIDKATGQVTYQVYLIFAERNAFRPSSMTFISPTGLKRVEVQRIDFDPSCSRYGCTIYEQAVAEVSREDMAHFASCAAPGTTASFSVKVFGSTIEGIESRFLCTEAAGLLVAVDAILASMGRSG